MIFSENNADFDTLMLEESDRILNTVKSKNVNVTIDIPKYGFVKFNRNNSVELVLPIPIPFNYGIVNDLYDNLDHKVELDAIILGERLNHNTNIIVKPVGIVSFIKNGEKRDKLICIRVDVTDDEYVSLIPEEIVSNSTKKLVEYYFWLYAPILWGIDIVKGQNSYTRYNGTIWL